jgi:hypothetical protein
MDKRDKMIIGGMAGAMVMVTLVVGYFMIVPYMEARSWGEDGDLELTISSQETSVDINDSISVTYTLTNVGDTPLRVVVDFSMWGPPMSLYDSNGDHVDYIGPMYSIEKDYYSGPPDHIVLKPGKSKSYSNSFSRDSWDIQEGQTYRVVGHYSAYENEISLPNWHGDLESNEIFISVL